MKITNTKTTKRALVASILSMLVCLSMLIGSTFAWFTDSATTGVNRIQAGTLDIDLVDAEGNSLEGKTIGFVKENGEAITDTILWEPGCNYLLQPVKLVNKGNLWAEYTLSFSAVTGAVDLAEVIEVYEEEVYIGTLREILNKQAKGVKTGVIAPKGEKDSELAFKALKLHMKEEAGNEYQGKSINSIAVTVMARQWTKEYDSFNNTYDKDAKYANADTYVADSAALATAIEKAEAGDVIALAANTYTANLTVNKDITLVGVPGTVFTGDITATGDIALTVENMTFDDGSINDSNMKALTVKNCVIINSGEKHFDFAQDEKNGYRSIKYEIVGNTFYSSTYPIMSWGSAADGSVFKNNTFGADDARIKSFAFRPLNVDDKATITIEGNTVYSSQGWAFSVYNNADREAHYTVIIKDNTTFVSRGDDAGFLWIDYRGDEGNSIDNSGGKIQPTLKFEGTNTYNGKDVAKNNIHSKFFGDNLKFEGLN